MHQLLEPISVINPYAPLIELPGGIIRPRRTMNLLLSFIEVITFYHQKQREQQIDKNTGELYIETTPSDIRWAFELLTPSLLNKSDERSMAARNFFAQLIELDFAEGQFTTRALKQELRIHPRTLSRHLNELVEHGYLEIMGGNRYREGYEYQILRSEESDAKIQTDNHFQTILKRIEAKAKRKSKKKVKKGSRTPVGQSSNVSLNSVKNKD